MLKTPCTSCDYIGPLFIIYREASNKTISLYDAHDLHPIGDEVPMKTVTEIYESTSGRDTIMIHYNDINNRPRIIKQSYDSKMIRLNDDYGYKIIEGFLYRIPTIKILVQLGNLASYCISDYLLLSTLLNRKLAMYIIELTLKNIRLDKSYYSIV